MALLKASLLFGLIGAIFGIPVAVVVGTVLPIPFTAVAFASILPVAYAGLSIVDRCFR